MASPEHHEAFAAAGDTRFVFAAWRGHPERPLHFLAEGNGLSDRELAKAELRCLYVECDAPEITTVHSGSGRRRDHYRHLRAPSRIHEPERMAHIQSKALIASWLRQLNVGVVEEEAAVDQDRGSIADVLLRTPDGQTMAFEVQYSPITVHNWQLRHERYRDAGVRDIWLFGHTTLLAERGRASGRFRLTNTHRTIAATGALIWFINPERGEVAVLANHRTLVAQQVPNVPAQAEDTSATLLIEKLDSLALSSKGIDGALVARLRVGWKSYRDLKAQRDELARARLQQAAKHRRQEEAEQGRSAAITEAARQLHRHRGDPADVTSAVFAARNLPSPSPADVTAVKIARGRMRSDEVLRERRAKAAAIVKATARRDDLLGKPFGELRRALDAALIDANLEPSRRAQQRQLERLLRARSVSRDGAARAKPLDLQALSRALLGP